MRAILATVMLCLVVPVTLAADPQRGLASVYGPPEFGKCVSMQRPAGGCERLDPREMTAASLSLPLGARAYVVNCRTGDGVTVRINDHGPYVHGRIIDLTPAAARTIRLNGLECVTVRRVP